MASLPTSPTARHAPRLPSVPPCNVKIRCRQPAPATGAKTGSSKARLPPSRRQPDGNGLDSTTEVVQEGVPITPCFRRISGAGVFVARSAPHTVPSQERASMSCHSTKVDRVCEICGSHFVFKCAPSKGDGRGRYCSRLCGNRAIGIAHAVQLEIRFFNSIGKKTKNGCILWNARLNKGGYGVICPNGRSKSHELLAHRVAFELLRGPIPDGLKILHTCPGGDNRQCVNPYHLRIGTQQENIADTVLKGRTSRGENRYNSKLTDALVIEARTLHRQGVVSYYKLAKRHGVSIDAMKKAIRGETWKHLTA